MSVASLTNRFHVVIVADEIESFVNVVLDQALQRIPHNFENALQYVMRYFEDCHFEGGVKTCGQARKGAVEEGKVILGKVPLQFFGKEGEIVPLRKLFKTMFSWFQARYKILEYEKMTASVPTGDNLNVPPPAQRLRMDPRVSFYAEDDDDISVQPPSDAQRVLAARLQHHADTLRFFDGLLDWTDGWPPLEELRNHADASEPIQDPLRSASEYSGISTISAMPSADATAPSGVSSKLVPNLLDARGRHGSCREQTWSSRV